MLNWCERKALLAGNQPAEQGHSLLASTHLNNQIVLRYFKEVYQES
jgi:hypothetical protein